MEYFVTFFLPLAGLAILIFLLSMLQYGISGKITEGDRSTADQHDTADKQAENVAQVSSDAVADAIHTYRRHRQANESGRAEREWVTIIVLAATAIFAFSAAGAAIYSAIMFSGQLGEMHQTSIDTGNLVKTARDTERRQLRAYIGIPEGKLRCTTCDAIRRGVLKSPLPGYRNSDMMLLTIQNGGQTPAYDVSASIFYKEMPLGKQLPPDFKYPDYPSPPDLPPMSHGMSNPGEKSPGGGLQLSPAFIMAFVRAQNNESTLYLYGHADYKDIFGRMKSTPFCVEYDPAAYAESERFVDCPAHNTPEPDKDEDGN